MLILTTGGTGFIGKALITQLLKLNHQVINLTRDVQKAEAQLPKAVKNYSNSDLSTVDLQQVEAIINLAGAPIDKFWTNAYLDTIRQSRLNVTQSIINLIHQKRMQPKVFISGSAIGYYGPQENHKTISEESPYVSHFTHTLCKDWEDLAKQATADDVRVCSIRTGLVLHPSGGMLKKILLPFRLGLGGYQGSGEQGFSWISLDDEIQAILFLLKRDDLNGAFNLTSPNPTTNKTFNQTLAKVLNRPCLLNVPAFILKPLLGKMSDLLLTGQEVIPTRLQHADFEYLEPNLEPYLKKILS